MGVYCADFSVAIYVFPGLEFSVFWPRDARKMPTLTWHTEARSHLLHRDICRAASPVSTQAWP